MFEDFTRVSQRSTAQEAWLHAGLQAVGEAWSRVVVLEFGAGAAVPIVRHCSECLARELGGLLVRINPRKPQAPLGQLSLPFKELEGIQWMLGDS